MTDSVDLVLDAQAQLGEGALWHAAAQRLYWVNIVAGEVHSYDPQTGVDSVFQIGQMVGTVVPRASGGLMLALKHGFASFDLHTGELTLLHDPDAHLPNNRFNDGKCDPAGRFWAGTMSEAGLAEPGVGSLYCLDTDLRLFRRLGDLTISNGLVWSHDRTKMYYIDSATQTIDALDYDHASGEISNRHVIVNVPKEVGLADGMTIDRDGMLWVATWGGGRVFCWNPNDGQLLRSIDLPVSLVTSCAFGGPNLDELYITSARIGLDDSALAREPLAGGLFVARPGVRGVEAFEFAG